MFKKKKYIYIYVYIKIKNKTQIFVMFKHLAAVGEFLTKISHIINTKYKEIIILNTIKNKLKKQQAGIMLWQQQTDVCMLDY